MNNKNIVSILGIIVLVIGGVILSDPSIRKMIPIGNSPSPVTINNARDGVENAVVTRVVDGDTILLEDGRKVRLLNIDTPETVKENTPVKCYGYEASSFAKKFLTNKSIQMVSDIEKTDRFGRQLRLVFLVGQDTTRPDQSFNYRLVAEGYARTSKIKPNIKFEPIMREAENSAKKSRIGVWGACQRPFEE